jgi:ketosteroid isomerase-like protein
MSQENLELAARWYEPWAAGKSELLTDMPRISELCHQNVEWSHREEGWTHHGREGVREALETWLESFDEYKYEVQQMIDCGGDEVLVVGVRSVSYELLTIRDGKIVRFREFHEESEALEAAGLRE